MENKTILLTGGTSGIGLTLAGILMDRGNRVITCGRTEEKIETAIKKHPELIVKQCDLSTADGMSKLVDFVKTSHADLDVLINNAAILNPMSMLDPEQTKGWEGEIKIDLMAPIDLTLQLLPLLMKRPEAWVINVTTGLIYASMASAPIYSAAKFGLHSFTQSLRIQLKDSNVHVMEVMPPGVDTPMTQNIEMPKISPEKVAADIVRGITKKQHEVRVGVIKLLYLISRIWPAAALRIIN